MNPRRFLPTFALALAWASPCFAQETPAEIARRELITQAESASDGGDHARALDLARRAGEIRMSTSLRLLLAQEHQSLGHTLEALESAGRCAREAQGDPTLRNRERILDACNAVVTALRAQVGRVVVRVEGAPANARVTVNGAEIPSALWGVPWPVMPGRVVVEASAEGHAPARSEFNARAGSEDGVTLTLTRAASTAPVASATALRMTAPSTAERRGAGAGPWFLVGAGVASVGAGVAFVLLQNDALAARDAACARWGCAPAARDHNDRATTWNLAANLSFGVGGAMIAGGVLWYVLARPRDDRPRTAFNVGVVPTSGGLSLGMAGEL